MLGPKRGSRGASGALAFALFAAMACVAGQAVGAEIAYISSSSGYMLHAGGTNAATANWTGQPPISGFTGYGPIRASGRCLTGRGPEGRPLTWEGCRSGDKAQIWALSNARLNNESGWCADVEGNRPGAGVRVLAWRCTGAVNQRWKAHAIVSANEVAQRIQNPQARAAFINNAARAQPGQMIDARSGGLIGVDAGTLRRAGQAMIVVRPGQLIAAGGLN